MTPTRLAECLALIGWRRQDLANQTKIDERQIRRWEAGATIPPPIAAWLERMARYHAANPAPPKTDRRRVEKY